MQKEAGRPPSLRTHAGIPQFLPRYHIARFSLLTSNRSDTPARQEPHQLPPPSQLPTPVERQALDTSPDPRRQGFTSMPNLGDPRSFSWDVGNSDVHEIKRGPPHTALNQLDTSTLFASLPSNARKRTGPDSSAAERPAAPTPHNVAHNDQSPKRSRPQSAPQPKRALGPARGSLASGT